MTTEPSGRRARGAACLVVALGVYLGAAIGCLPAEEPAPPGAVPAEPVGAAAARLSPAADAPQAERTPPAPAERRREREAMVRVIRDVYGLRDEAVLAAMAAVPRHEFVPPAYAAQAYADHPLPTAHGQTISQPYIVAEMTRQLRLRGGENVLEVGTGSGYQAAVLTHFTTHVYTIEIIRPLADSAAQRLKRLGYGTVQVRCGDGLAGWPETAPFDAIMVTFTVDEVPPALLGQLKPGGRMVVPVAGTDGMEWLTVVEKAASGEVQTRRILPVRFVPMLREDPSRR
ncbi:MAG: protein-L-isoaspartate(D-aspartate) O-methyltransferase [Planctomycetes bacterium]|nr:protein-L-isoaspartate(D-aspartate) O-methyltransferase [Planctomycetota bacterium]